MISLWIPFLLDPHIAARSYMYNYYFDFNFYFFIKCFIESASVFWKRQSRNYSDNCQNNHDFKIDQSNRDCDFSRNRAAI